VITGIGRKAELRVVLLQEGQPILGKERNMLRARSILTSHRFITRAYATATSPHALIFLEHKDGTIESGSLSALTAAQQLGGTVTGLVVGGPDQIPTVLESVKKYTSSVSSSFNF
jgi:hypothetical protein